MSHRHSIFALTVAALIALCLRATPGAAQQDIVGQWSQGSDLPYFPVHVHMLPTEKVMIWPGDGGVSGNDPRSWTPATESVSPLSKPGYDLFCSGHSFLADGTLFVAGGHIQNSVGLARASTYNPFTNTWSNLPNMNAGRWYPTTTVLANGDVLVVSGEIDGTVGVNTVPQVFQVSTQTWRNLTALGQDLYPMMLLAPNGKVFNAGPTTVTRYLDTSGNGTWTVVANRVGGYRDYGSAVMYAPGKVLVMGGGDPPNNTAEVIDLNQAVPSWRRVGDMQFPRRQINAVLLPDGKVLITGGTSGSGFNNSGAPVYAAELWDPATETWSLMASASIPRLYHSATLLLPNGQVLSTGGNGYPQTEIYSPPYLFKGTRPEITSAPLSVAYGQSFFIETPDAATISKVTMLRLSSVTHAFNMSQYINVLSVAPTPTSGGLNVTAPPNGNVAPPGHYLLFILNGNGPSVAKIVQLVAATPPPPPPLPEPSPDGTRGVTVVDSEHTVWTFGQSGETLRDGVHMADGYAGEYLYLGAVVYAKSGSNWYNWTGSAWALFGPNDPTGTPPPPSPGDPTPPTVSVTAPASGATVSGAAVTVSANATDNVGVAGVQFKLDGANLGAEDTTAPYSINWNSTAASNGPHTLTAVARDAAGNITTSAGTSVTVNNVVPSAPSAPAGLVASVVAHNRINLTWTDSAGNESGFKIERKTATGSFSQIATLKPNVTSYSNTGLTRNTQYSYRVRAYNGAGDSAYSNTATATTLNK